MSDAGGKKVAALESWAMETAKDLFPLMDYDDQVKLAIGLIQARATEAQHASTGFAVSNMLSGIMALKAALFLKSNEAACAVAFSNRHAELENFGVDFATRYLKEKEEGKGVIN